MKSYEMCRYVNDGKPFWQYIVSSSTGCSDTQYFEELYNYYTTEKVSSYYGKSEIVLSQKLNSTQMIFELLLLI